MRRRCILVDDNAAFLDSASRLLEAQGMIVCGVAGTRDQAMALVAETQPGVALVDVELGAESGLDVAGALRRAQPSVPVILISTHAEEDVADIAADSPAVGFLAKSRLGAAAIDELLSRRRGT